MLKRIYAHQHREKHIPTHFNLNISGERFAVEGSKGMFEIVITLVNFF